jgi:hypothetical protein
VNGKYNQRAGHVNKKQEKGIKDTVAKQEELTASNEQEVSRGTLKMNKRSLRLLSC